jgi:Fic family protein
MVATEARYTPIRDLPQDWKPLEVRELRALDEVWREQRGRLEDLDELERFRQRLIRSWAIETGVIERVYSIDRGVTELLIEEGIKQSLVATGTDRNADEVVAILNDHEEAIDALFDFVARRRELSTSFVKELHALLTRNQRTTVAVDHLGRTVERELLHGAWKRLPNNPRRPHGSVHAYCPPELVDSEMDDLIGMHLAHEESEVVPEVEAAWLHHRFTQIHPFQDGNGRVARALASLVYIRGGWFPLSIHRDQKVAYIDALEGADRGDLAPLVRLFGRVAREALVRALAVGDQSEQDLSGIRQVVGAARDRMLGTTPEVTPDQLQGARETADRLRAAGRTQLEAVKSLIDRDITGLRQNFSVQVEEAPPDDRRAKWYRASLIGFAQRDLHYFANLGTYATWLRLRLNDFDVGARDDLVVSLHGMGQTFRGLIAGVAFYERADKREDEERLVTSEQALIQPELFQVNHLEDYAEAERRFCEWVNDSCTIGLGMWERGLESG